MSHITVIGNMTRAGELRFTASGLATCSFGVAESYKPRSGADEKTSFFNVTCFGSLAEAVAESLDKGTRVVVTGRMEQRSWETPEGEKKTVWDLVADACGPDLRFATCKVTRNERSTTGATSRPGVETYDRGVRQPAGSHTAGVPYDDGEEPFLLDAHVDTVPSRRLFGGIQ
jgi:single-strand DNA-binding protein